MDFKLFSFQAVFSYKITSLNYLCRWLLSDLRTVPVFHKRNIDRAGTGECAPGEGCVLRNTLEWLQSCSMQVTVPVQVSPATFLRKPVQPVDWHPVNRGIVAFQDWEGREVTFAKHLPYGISPHGSSEWVLAFFLQLRLREVKQLAEDHIDYKWRNWFANAGRNDFLDICDLPLTWNFLQGGES